MVFGNIYKKYLENGKHSQTKDEDKLHVVRICVRGTALLTIANITDPIKLQTLFI